MQITHISFITDNLYLYQLCITEYKNIVHKLWVHPFVEIIFIIKKKQGKSEGFDGCDRPSNLTQIGFKSSIFQPVWPWHLMVEPKNNRAPLLCYFKLFASFRSHWWIQTGVTVRKRLIWVKIDDSFSRVTLKFDGWPSKTIGHLS